MFTNHSRTCMRFVNVNPRLKYC